MPLILGTILNDAGLPCARIVRAYRRDTGAFVEEVVSNATTGAYTLTVPATEINVVALDDAPGTSYNDKILRVNAA